MNLRKPSLEDKEELKKYVDEHHANGEMSISASNGMPTMEYEVWLEKLKNDESSGNNEWGISETYILEDNAKIIGMLNIRYTLADEKAQVYGHIGYGVRPSERKKGYATYILKEALIKCRERGMKEVILGCFTDNIGSNKTIINNNGVLYNKDLVNDKEALYYKIKL